MIKIDAPSVFFVNKTEMVSCTVSGMVFALGAALNLKSLEENNRSLFNDLGKLSIIISIEHQYKVSV